MFFRPSNARVPFSQLVNYADLAGRERCVSRLVYGSAGILPLSRGRLVLRRGGRGRPPDSRREGGVTSRFRSERQAQPELNLPLSGSCCRACGKSEVSTPQPSVRRGKSGVVHHVEELGAELHARPFGDVRILDQRGVKTPPRRADEGIAS
jgi:hypothetical protein